MQLFEYFILHLRAFGISIFQKKIQNVNFMPTASYSYPNKFFLGSFDISGLIPCEKIGYGELMSSWAEGNPGWAYGPPK